MLFADQLLGKYKIVSTLGSGGFGTVYLAEDTWLDKKVAVKVPHRQEQLAELLREPRLLAKLDHPNIVNITTAEKQQNIFFIVMEYVPGDTLESVIATKGALEVDLALGYATQIGQAVEHAHKQGIIHRDLRPANVLVSSAGTLKVADFGTSRFLEISTHGTTVIGSPAYMAPEQFRGEAVFASDLYSLGITMYQMLTGVLPYDTPAPSDLEQLHRGELVRPPHMVNSSITRELSSTIMKALSPQIADRYQRAGDLLADLKEIKASRRLTPVSSATPRDSISNVQGIVREPRSKHQTQTHPTANFCWRCRKPMHARNNHCPFCGEAQ
ncbi:MAG: hypothetical protein CL484_15805 [Acidobacteria bacterium]|nr:hypothetical protein [Acidobacteriota bacterium]|tara:strand:+ start:18537 stop:19517 length:981 start_codon:yes stop_codon:yes gene_type:complete